MDDLYIIVKRYYWLFSFGFMFTWASALFNWLDYANSPDMLLKTIGIVAALVITATEIVTFLFFGHKDEEAERFKEEARSWENSAVSHMKLFKEYELDKVIEQIEEKRRST